MDIQRKITPDTDTLELALDHDQRIDRKVAARIEQSPLSSDQLPEISDIIKSEKANLDKIDAAVAMAANPSIASLVPSSKPALSQGKENATLISSTKAPIESAKAPRVLTPEQAAEALRTLEARFTSKEGQALHKGVEWTKVKASLEAKPEALWSINEMEKAGHEPDVYNSDEKGFDIGTCSKESPASGRSCVYDEEAAQLVLNNNPNAKFNGSAVAMAKAMGINLMDPNLYKNVLQKKGKFDLQTWSWLLTQLGIRSTGDALFGVRDDDGVHVVQDGADGRNDFRSWRGSLRVEWAA